MTAEIQRIANKIMEQAKSNVLLRLRFLNMVIGRLSDRIADTDTIVTNGEEVGYNPLYIFDLYKAGEEYVSSAYLHVMLHCIFKHPYVSSLVDHDRWNLACDIAVENIIDELSIEQLRSLKSIERRKYLEDFRKTEKIITAERVYRALLDLEVENDVILRLGHLFEVDDHELWYDLECQTTQGNKTCDGGETDDPEDGNNGIIGSVGNDGSEPAPLSPPDIESSSKWDDVEREMKVDIESFSREYGSIPNSLLQNIRAVTRERYDYTSFLKRFAVLGEAMQINDEEFDHILYTYGLKLYDNMPLLEPLEYKEVKRIKDFVIAIDTSGSVQGDLVQTFIQKTYNVLKSTESFFSKINIYVIQCDAEIQQVFKITSEKDFESLLDHMVLKGFGGTDFRPVFSFVDELRRRGELLKMKGLIFFTDGYGIFPEKKPDYDAAFVFIKDDYEEPNVPPWAIKMVLEKSDLTEMKKM